MGVKRTGPKERSDLRRRQGDNLATRLSGSARISEAEGVGVGGGLDRPIVAFAIGGWGAVTWPALPTPPPPPD